MDDRREPLSSLARRAPRSGDPAAGLSGDGGGALSDAGGGAGTFSDAGGGGTGDDSGRDGDGASDTRDGDGDGSGSPGRVELLADLDRPGGWLLSVEGVAQSYVDLADPTYLDFGYLQWFAVVVAATEPPGDPLEAVHLGGGAGAFARFLAAVRPGSQQLVLEVDPLVLDLVSARLGPAPAGVRTLQADAAAALPTLPARSADLVVLDAFQGAVLPPELVTTEHTREVRRVLRPGGTYLVNLADGPGLDFTRRVLATVTAVFPHVVVLAGPDVLRGRRFGNLVVAAAHRPLPVAAIRRATAGEPHPARVLDAAAVADLVGVATVISAVAPVRSPVPPPPVLSARRPRGATP